MNLNLWVRKLEKDNRERIIKMCKLDVNRIKQVDPSLASDIVKLYREYIQVISQLEESRKAEREALAELSAIRIELDAKIKEVDTLKMAMSRFESMFNEKVKEANNLRLEIEDLTLRTGIAETSFKYLLNVLDEMHEKIVRRYVEDIPASVRNDILQNLSMVVEQVNTILKSMKTPVEVGKK